MKSKSLRHLQRWRDELIRQLGVAGPFIRGSVMVLRMPCTQPKCRKCASGEKHPGLYLSISTRGKTRLFYLPKAIQKDAREWAVNYRRLQELLEELSEVNREMLFAEAKARKSHERENTKLWL